MRVNQDGFYEVTEGEIYIKDPATGDKMIFIMDESETLVLRSMLEEDIKVSMSIKPKSSSDKRKKMSALWEAIPTPGSETYFYVLELISKDQNKNHPYERDREIIGIGIRKDTKKEIRIIILKDVDDELLKPLPEIIKRLAKEFRIEGEPYFFKR